MTTNYTPGPWYWDGNVWQYDREEEAPWLINQAGHPIIKGEIECSEADAKLISAAPDLLAACVEFIRKCECGEARSVRSYAQMKAAIEKAGVL